MLINIEKCKLKDLLFFFPLLNQWKELPAFLSFCGFTAGIIIFHILPVRDFFINFQILLFILSFLLIISGIIISKKKVRFFLFLITGFTLSALEYSRFIKIDSMLYNLSDKTSVICGEIVSPISPTKNFFSFDLKIEKIDTISNLLNKNIIIKVLSERKISSKAQKICIRGRIFQSEEKFFREILSNYGYFKPFVNRTVIFIDSVLSYEQSKKFPTKLFLQMREKINRVISRYENPEHRALIRAAFLAERGYIVPEVKEAFFKSGLSHLLALSGLHAGILLVSVYMLLALFPPIWSLRHILAIVVLWVYLFFVGFIPSLTRATLMCTLVILALLYEKKNYPLQSIGIAGLSWLIFSPSSLFDIGFQLSYSSTFGILTLYPFLTKLFLQGSRRGSIKILIKKFFISPLLISLSTLITTLPLLLYHFRGFSVYGIFGNIFATLLMSCAMWLFFLSLFIDIIFPSLTKLTLFCSSLFLDLLLSLAEGATKIPFSYCKVNFWSLELVILYFLLLIGIITISKEKRTNYLIIVLPLFLALIPTNYLLSHMLPESTSVYVTNDFRTSSISIIWKDKKIWFICSGEEDRILNTLSKNFIPSLGLIPNSMVERIIIATPNNCLIDSLAGNKKIVLDKIIDFKTTKFSSSVNISLKDNTVSLNNNTLDLKIKNCGKYLLLLEKNCKSSKYYQRKITIPVLIFFSKNFIRTVK